MELKDLDFYFKKKKFPEMSDQGRVTLRFLKKGATLTIIFRVDQGPADKNPTLDEGEVHFQIDKLDIQFDKGSLKHNILVPMATNMMKNKIQLQIEREVEAKMKNLVKKIGEQLTGLLVQINRPIKSGFDKVKEFVKDSV